MSTDRHAVAFNRFGGLRLDLPLDEIGGEQAQYLRDVDWDGSTGRLRPRDGFQKLKAAEASGPYKALFPHSAIRLLATKRVSAESVKLVAIDKEGVEKVEATWPKEPATACFAGFGTPSASYTYCRANLTSAKVVRFDGTSFTEPTATVDGVAAKEMPRAKFMAAWPAGGYRLIHANTGAAGGPNGAASSNSHVWFSEAEGKSEAYESTAYLQLSPGDGEEITGLEVWGGMVFIFKETKFFVVYGISISEQGKPIFNYREVSLGVGGRMRRPTVEALAESSDKLTCVSVDGVYFCTSAGVFVTTGQPPSKISQALRPLEEVSPFDGPMAEFLNGSTESFRWPATGILSLGTRLIVRRYEFMFVLDIPTGEWTCWKMPAVSMCVWTGLSGGGAEVALEKTAGTAASSGTPTWTNPNNAKVKDGSFATVGLTVINELAKLDLTNFAPVPAGATILGFAVNVWANANSTGSATARLAEVLLLREGAPSGNLLSTFPPDLTAADTLYSFGGAESFGEGGGPWTAAQVNAATSGVRATVQRRGGTGTVTAGIDAILLTVYYLTPEAASGVRPRLFCSQSKSVFYTAPTAEEQAATRQAEWQSGIYNLGSDDEKEVAGVRVFGSGTFDALSYSDFDTSPSVSGGHFVLPSSGNRSDLDDNALTDSGVVFSHRLKLEPGSRVQKLIRYVREGRTPITKGR